MSRRAEVEARVETGEGLQLLLAAASVADPRWRLVFDAAVGLAAAWQQEEGRRLLTEVSSLGRFGWINLAGLAIVRGSGGSRDELLELVTTAEPDELHAALLGGQRLQLAELLGPDTQQTVLAAVRGSRPARGAVRRALASDRTNLEVSRWLWSAAPPEVRVRCRSVLERLPAPGPGPDPAPMRALVQSVGFAAALAQVAPRLHYRPGALHRVALVASPAVAPVIVEIDLPELSVIVHPPLPEPGRPDPADRLRQLGRALGDDARMRILTELRGRSRTLPELCAALERPRTTLLHHLALLRGAGLIEVVVSPHGPNAYRLDDTGFRELTGALSAFVDAPLDD